MALAYYLTSVGNFALLTPIAMVLYQVLWLLPTLLLAGLVSTTDGDSVALPIEQSLPLYNLDGKGAGYSRTFPTNI